MVLRAFAAPRGVWKSLIIAECPGDRQTVKVALPAAVEVAL